MVSNRDDQASGNKVPLMAQDQINLERAFGRKLSIRQPLGHRLADQRFRI